MPESKSPRYITAAIVIIVVGFTALIVINNWPKIHSFYQRVAGTFRDLKLVRQQLQEKFPAQRIETRSRRNLETGVRSFIITVTNPSFIDLDKSDSVAMKTVALRIARAVLDLASGKDTYQEIRVVLSKETSPVVPIGRNYSFLFGVNDLSQR